MASRPSDSPFPRRALAAAASRVSTPSLAWQGLRYPTRDVAADMAARHLLASGSEVLVERDEAGDDAPQLYRVDANGALVPTGESPPVAAIPRFSGPTRVVTDTYNVEWEGAVPDPRVNNTPAMQASIDRVEAAGGGRVLVPPGVWGYHNLRLGEGVELVGTAGSVLRVVDDFRRIVDIRLGIPNVKSGIGPRLPRRGDRGPAATATFGAGGVGTIRPGDRGIAYCAVRHLDLDGNAAGNPAGGLGDSVLATDEVLFLHPGFSVFGHYGRIVVEDVAAHDCLWSLIVVGRHPSPASTVEITGCRTRNSTTDAHLYLNGGGAVVRDHVCSGFAAFPYVQGHGGMSISGLRFEDLRPSPHPRSSGRLSYLIGISDVDLNEATPGRRSPIDIAGVEAHVDLDLAGGHLFHISGGRLRATVTDVGRDPEAFTETIVLAATGIESPPSRHLDVSVVVESARRGIGAVTSNEESPQRFSTFLDSTIRVEIRYRDGLPGAKGGAALAQLARAERSHFDVRTNGAWTPDVGLIFTGRHGGVQGCTFTGTLHARSASMMVLPGARAPVGSTARDVEATPNVTPEVARAMRFENVRFDADWDARAGRLIRRAPSRPSSPVSHTGANGTAVFSGTGSQRVFRIRHGLAAAPDDVNVTVVTTGDARHTTAATAAEIVVTFSRAPARGTDNVTIRWDARLRR